MWRLFPDGIYGKSKDFTIPGENKSSLLVPVRPVRIREFLLVAFLIANTVSVLMLESRDRYCYHQYQALARVGLFMDARDMSHRVEIRVQIAQTL